MLKEAAYQKKKLNKMQQVNYWIKLDYNVLGG